jgi:hypothetical protein
LAHESKVEVAERIRHEAVGRRLIFPSAGRVGMHRKDDGKELGHRPNDASDLREARSVVDIARAVGVRTANGALVPICDATLELSPSRSHESSESIMTLPTRWTPSRMSSFARLISDGSVTNSHWDR